MHSFKLLIFTVIAAASSFGAAEAAGSGIYLRAEMISLDHTQGRADTARIVLRSGPHAGQTVTANVTTLSNPGDISTATYRPGDAVITNFVPAAGEIPASYTVLDHYRLPAAAWLLAIVVGLAIIFAGWRGIGSLAGLVLSILVLGGLVLPQVLRGQNPYPVTALGILLISSIGIFVAHGFSRRTGLALAGTYVTIIIAVAAAAAAAGAMALSGIGSDSTLYLAQLQPNLDIRGLLLCGMIIGIIGILDDITVGQATAVEELSQANPKMGPTELYRRGLKIGREHIASLINTLVLAYVGSSFLFIVYIASNTAYPLWMTINSELVMEEIVRSLVGSVALILAVPITTWLAARFLKKA